MNRIVALDSGPLGLATQKPGKSDEVDECLQWVRELTRARIKIIVPEIADYEVRRELLRAGAMAGVRRLDAFVSARTDRYIPLDTAAMRKAAEMWADARNVGIPTTDRHALDGDVILAAQVLTLTLPDAEITVATDNLRHLVRYLPSVALWRDIKP